jgi:hypothetical protein
MARAERLKLLVRLHIGLIAVSAFLCLGLAVKQSQRGPAVVAALAPPPSYGAREAPGTAPAPARSLGPAINWGGQKR